MQLSGTAIDSDGHVVEDEVAIARYLPPDVTIEWSPLDVRVNGQNIQDRPPSPASWAMPNEDDRYEQSAARRFDNVSHLRVLDEEGFSAAALFPGKFLAIPYGSDVDPATAAVLCRAYNDWLAEYREPAPDRLLGVALVALGDVEAAEAEIRRAVGALGARAVMVRPNPVLGRNLGNPAYDRLYSVMEELDVPLTVHEGLSARLPQLGRDRFTTFFERHVSCHPFEQMAACLSLVSEGALARHPRLRVAFLESGSGWVPYWLSRMDAHYKVLAADVPELTMAPSEYFRRQCFISTEPGDEMLVSVLDYLGDENIVFASDYPHPDAEYPGILRGLREEARIKESSKARILEENPRRLFAI